MQLTEQGQYMLDRLGEELAAADLPKGLLTVVSGMVKGIVEAEKMDLMVRVDQHRREQSPQVNDVTLTEYAQDILGITIQTGWEGLTVYQMREEIKEVIRGAVSLGMEYERQRVKEEQEKNERYERNNMRL